MSTEMRAEENSHSCNTFIVKTMWPVISTTLSEVLKMEVGEKPAIVHKVLTNECKQQTNRKKNLLMGEI